MGNLEGIFRGFFLTHRTKAPNFRGKFRSVFCKKIRGSKKIFQGFSNVPWHKRAFWPGTKYLCFDQFLGILGALCTGKGALLVRYLCTT